MAPENAARPVEEIANEAVATLERYLGFFYEKGHPGRPCLRSGWVHVDHIAQDRARVERLWSELQPGSQPPKTGPVADIDAADEDT